MTKFKTDASEGLDNFGTFNASTESDTEIACDPDLRAKDELSSKATTIGVVVVGAALIEAAWIPAILVGAAAALAPNLFPKLGQRVEPLLNSAMRGAYKAVHKARSAMGEVQERMSDIAAEVHAEEVSKAQTVANNDAASKAV